MRLDNFKPGDIRVEDQRGMPRGKQRIMAAMGSAEAEERRLRTEAFDRARKERDSRSNQRNQNYISK